MKRTNTRCSYIHRDERGAEQCTAEAVQDGLCEVHVWRTWFERNCSDWEDVDDIEAELGRKAP